MNDERLARKLKRGDRMALDRAVEAYTPYLSAVVWNAMGASASAEDVEEVASDTTSSTSSVVWNAMGASASAEDVEEVVSDAFLALWSSRERLDPERGIKAWLAAVARNKAVDRLRTAPAASLPLDEAGEQSGGALEDELERRMFAQALWRAVEDLPPPDGQLVFRFYYEGERLKDIARDIGLSVPAAKSRLCRARRKLKEILEKGGLTDGAAG